MELSGFLFDLLFSEASILKIILGSIFGLCLGLTGVGGGVLLIPMLQFFCEMPPVLAVGTASMISAMVKVNASFFHLKANNVSWRQMALLFLGALPLTLLVTQCIVFLNEHPVHSEITQSLVSFLVLLVMFGSLASVLIKYLSHRAGTKQAESGKPNKSTAVLSGMFCGTVLGSTGVGGGVLLLPIFTNLLNVDIKKAIGSSVVVALLLSSVAALGYAKGGQSDFGTALLFLIGSFAGVPLASIFMSRLSENSIYLITLAIIGTSCVLYLFTETFS